MNQSSLESFHREINQVHEYLKHIQYVNNIASYSVPLEIDQNQELRSLLEKFKEHYRFFRIDKRVFEYKATIISLYGVLERFVETWIKEYLDALSNIVPEYKQLEEKFKEKHFELSLRLISTITSRESAKYNHLKKESILKNLNDCIENSPNYKMNTEAFVLLSGNLKHPKLVELFKPLNIDLNDRLKKNETLSSHIQNEQEIKNVANLKTDILYNNINELVERRNEIAHGATINNILDHSEIVPYVHFLEKYCQAIFEILLEETIKQESIHRFQRFNPILDIFNKEILAFEIENCQIKVGDLIIVKTPEDRFFKKSILEIQLDNTSYQQIEINNKAKIALKLEPPIKRNQEFFIRKVNG